MKVDLYITMAGAEALAKGQELYPWFFEIRNPKSTLFSKGDENSILVAADVELLLPSLKAAAEQATKGLEKALQEARVNAFKLCQELEQRISALALIGYDGGSAKIVSGSVEDAEGNF
jgi:hypothetical protein